MNTAIHYGIFYVTYTYMGLYHLLASTLGFGFAVTNSYIVNKYWTFKTRGSKKRREFAKFIIVNLVTLSINLGSMALLVEQCGMDPRIAQLASIGLTLSINFLGNKFWTFRQKA
ncbi:MAG: GtrA family protein [Phycisphaeraceae bacterium]|nr:GtrA family protein [Phycisphaeraceae bacterium]